MQIKHYICPRICGKSTFAEKLQNEDPENILLFKYDNGIPWGWGHSMICEHWDKIIFDEYILRYNSLSTPYKKNKLHDWILCNVCSRLNKGGELILISTPDKQYDSLIYYLMSIDSIHNVHKDVNLPKRCIDRINKEVDEINGKFLNPRDVNIIKTNLDGVRIPEHNKETYRIRLGEEKYKTEILGEFLR